MLLAHDHHLQHVDAEDDGLPGALLVCFNITEDGTSRQRVRLANLPI